MQIQVDRRKTLLMTLLTEKMLKLYVVFLLQVVGVDDNLIWGHLKNGILLLKSAYHVKHTRMRLLKGEHSKLSKPSAGWQLICDQRVQGMGK